MNQHSTRTQTIATAGTIRKQHACLEAALLILDGTRHESSEQLVASRTKHACVEAALLTMDNTKHELSEQLPADSSMLDWRQ